MSSLIPTPEPVHLPITAHLSKLISTLEKYRRCVLSAEPGAGKSTAVPLALLNDSLFAGQQIILLEPRRVAVKALASYLAQSLGEKVGATVGYQIRNDQQVSTQTRLLIVTEGILTQRLQHDPELTGVGCIIFDEFHERSVPADLGLMLSYEVQQSLRESLCLLVMSASMNTLDVAKYLGEAPVISAQGRTFPVTTFYRPVSEQPQRNSHLSKLAQYERALPQHIGLLLLEIVKKSDHQGDILVFLPGLASIKHCLKWCREHVANVQIFSLYGGLALDKQTAILQRRSPNPAVIFATNIAETSLTLPNVTVVIDSGLEKRSEFDVKSGLTKLSTHYISEASAIQRQGRAGRVQAGYCYRLWPTNKILASYPPLPITTSDLSSVVLECMAWGMQDTSTIPWLDAPPPAHIAQAQTTLSDLGLLDNKGLTSLGKQAESLGIEPRFATMLLQAQNPSEKSAALALCALLSEKDILLNDRSVDIIPRVHILFSVLKSELAPTSTVNQVALSSVVNLFKSLARRVSLPLQEVVLPAQDTLFKMALLGFPDRLAKGKGHSYTLSNGRGVVLHELDALSGMEWCVVLDCDGQNQGGAIYSAVAGTTTAVIANIATQEERVYQLEKSTDKVKATIQQRYRHLLISESPLGDWSGTDVSEVLVSLVQNHGLQVLNFTEGCQKWCARVCWLHQYCPTEVPLIDEAFLLQHIADWFLPYVAGKSLAQARKIPLLPLLEAILDYSQQQYLTKHAPKQYQAPDGKMFDIRYLYDEPPTVALQLQSVFGELASPLLAQGQVPLRFELLSPAQRPIQVTADLAGFWGSSYFAVAKEMRGRYPKHRWPEEPLLEKAGRSIKAKKS